jgi:hypothetical protein
VRHVATLAIGLAVQLAASPASADRASDLAAQASGAQRETCQNVTGLSTCHPQYPTGCSHSANPQYDPYLNLLKNQTPAPSMTISRYITQTAIQSLDASTPSGITSHNHATFAATLSGPGIREGNIVGLVGYLYFVSEDRSREHELWAVGSRRDGLPHRDRLQSHHRPGPQRRPHAH